MPGSGGKCPRHGGARDLSGQQGSREGEGVDDRRRNGEGCGLVVGPVGMGWVDAGCVKKELDFWQKRSPNCGLQPFQLFGHHATLWVGPA
jgi:hypothetical protein